MNSTGSLRPEGSVSPAAVAAARAAASAAAHRSGVTIRQVHELPDVELVRQVIDDIWSPRAGDPPVTQGILRALTHGGNYCTLAWDGDRAIGVSLAFLGIDPPGSLHSHITGVAGAAGRHVGRALKLDQRAWALEHGLTTVMWTYDPLVRRNAYFNAGKLGALPTKYLVDFYGTMDDAINAGQATDRLAVTWRLLDPRVVALCDGDGADPAAAAALADGAEVALDEVDGQPVAAAPPPRGPLRLVRVPADVEALRRSDPETATRWRLAVREQLGGLMDAGWAVSGASKEGFYVVSRGEAP
jgi:predicted GNAT superfamily acetyltransferase